MVYLDPHRLPVIDISKFEAGDPWRQQVAAQVDRASCRFGSFQIVGHGVDSLLMETLAELNGKLFSPGAQAGDEITFDPPSSRSHCAARARPVPWRAQNAYDLPGLREAVQEYLTVLTGLGHNLMTLFARGMSLHDGYFVDRYTGNPETLLSVVAHCSEPAGQRAPRQQPYGKFLTLVMPDADGGLEVWHRDRKLEVAPLAGALVCQVGRGLERLSGGRYPAARHELRSNGERMQLSLVFSFAPNEAHEALRTAEPLAEQWVEPLHMAMMDDDDAFEEEELEFRPERRPAARAVMSLEKSQ